jgi:hypothetical protein
MPHRRFCYVRPRILRPRVTAHTRRVILAGIDSLPAGLRAALLISTLVRCATVIGVGMQGRSIVCVPWHVKVFAQHPHDVDGKTSREWGHT